MIEKVVPCGSISTSVSSMIYKHTKLILDGLSGRPPNLFRKYWCRGCKPQLFHELVNAQYFFNWVPFQVTWITHDQICLFQCFLDDSQYILEIHCLETECFAVVFNGDCTPGTDTANRIVICTKSTQNVWIRLDLISTQNEKKWELPAGMGSNILLFPIYVRVHLWIVILRPLQSLEVQPF